MKTYREVRKDLAEGGHGEPETFPCETCSRPTPREAMSNFGARCGACFTAYCRGAFSGQPVRQVSRAEAERKLAQFVGRG